MHSLGKLGFAARYFCHTTLAKSTVGHGATPLWGWVLVCHAAKGHPLGKSACMGLTLTLGGWALRWRTDCLKA